MALPLLAQTTHTTTPRLSPPVTAPGRNQPRRRESDAGPRTKAASTPAWLRTCSSPSARLSTWLTCSSSGPTSPKTCNFAGAGAGKPQIGLAARPASRSYEGRRRRLTAAEASPVFAKLEPLDDVGASTDVTAARRTWFPPTAGQTSFFPASCAQQGRGSSALQCAVSGAEWAGAHAATGSGAAAYARSARCRSVPARCEMLVSIGERVCAS